MEQRKTKDGKNFPSPIRITTYSSDDVAAARRKRQRARNTTNALRAFRTSLESVPEALQGTNPIPLADLASKLAVEPKRLLPLLEHGYLKLVTPDPPVVLEPPPAAMDWLRVMFQPLNLRPFLASEMVAELEGVPVHHVRQLCLEYNIPIYSDPVFGEVMSVSAFYRFHKEMHNHRESSRLDRQAMLVMLMHTVSPDEWRTDINPPRFSRKIEMEIRRIAALAEPARTDAALRLWTAWSETYSVARAIAAAQGKEDPPTPKTMKRLEAMLSVEVPTSPIGDYLGSDASEEYRQEQSEQDTAVGEHQDSCATSASPTAPVGELGPERCP